MKKYFVNIVLLALVASMAIFAATGCESDSNDDSSSSSAVIERGPFDIKYLNNGRTQMVLEDGWTLNIDGNTKISYQRLSCSGVEYGENLFSIDFEASVEYKIDMKALSTSVPDKEATAITIVAYRKSCIDPPVQYILDTDRDGYTDNVDAYPNDPTRHEEVSGGSADVLPVTVGDDVYTEEDFLADQANN